MEVIAATGETSDVKLIDDEILELRSFEGRPLE
jgi:hypothetical protein